MIYILLLLLWYDNFMQKRLFYNINWVLQFIYPVMIYGFMIRKNCFALKL